jgi:hypothetical protein
MWSDSLRRTTRQVSWDSLPFLNNSSSTCNGWLTKILIWMCAAFLFHYVHYFRVLYHKLSAQATGKGGTIDQAVVRPVAEHGAVEMPSHLFARKREETSSPSALPPTLRQLLIPFSQGGLWLKKDSKACADSDQTSCHSPNSTHHVDNATSEDHLLERWFWFTCIRNDHCCIPSILRHNAPRRCCQNKGHL